MITADTSWRICCVGRLKEWRAVATCYEKTVQFFFGIFCLAAADSLNP